MSNYPTPLVTISIEEYNELKRKNKIGEIDPEQIEKAISDSLSGWLRSLPIVFREKNLLPNMIKYFEDTFERSGIKLEMVIEDYFGGGKVTVKLKNLK